MNTDQSSDYRWDIPDLHIRIVGNIAIGWGPNRVRDAAPARGAVVAHGVFCGA